MPGSHTGTLPGWQDGGKPAARGARLAGLPSLIGLGARPRSCRRDTWEERGGRLGPSFKARVCFPGAGGREPQKAARGPRPVSVGSGQLREAGQAWPGSGIPVGAGRGGTVPVPAVRPELPEELLLRWLNPLAGKPGTPRLSSPRGCGGIPNGWSRQPRDQAAPQNWVSADGSRPPPPPPVSRAPFPSQNAGTAAHLHIALGASKKILLARSGAAPREVGGFPAAAAALLTSSGSGRWRTRSRPPQVEGPVAWVPC